jgi:cytochrome P450
VDPVDYLRAGRQEEQMAADNPGPAVRNPNPETGEVSLFDPEFARCPQPVFQRLRSECPVTRAAFTASPVIARYEDVVWALRHPEIFSSEMDLQMALGTERPMIPQQIDPPAQTRYRKILDPRFSRRRMAEIEPDVRASANRLIDRFVDAGECEFDRDFAVPLPCQAFLSLMGLPQEELGLFLELKDLIIRPQERRQIQSLEDARAIRAEAGRRIYAYFEELIDARRSRSGDDLMGYLVTAEIDGEKLSRNEILDICFLLILAGLDTVTATLGCNVAYLAANPEQRRKLVRRPELIPAAVEELLRWETPVMAVPRLARRDVELHGFQIREGELVTLLLGSADTDDAEFADAQLVDFERARNRHVAFGAGPHRCLGSHLARMELEVALEEWHRRVPDYAIRQGEQPIYSPGIREVRYLPLVWGPSGA